MPLLFVDRFAITKKPFAINRQSFNVERRDRDLKSDIPDTFHWYAEVEAFSWRKNQGVVTARLGMLKHFFRQVEEPTFNDFIRSYNSSRWDSSSFVISRWNGEQFQTRPYDSSDKKREAFLALDDALADYPNAPRGYEGWFVPVLPGTY